MTTTLLRPARTESSAITAPPEDLPLAANPVAINRAVGYIAFLMPPLLILSAWLTGICNGQIFLDSLSHHYYAPLGGSIFTGALCCIGLLMIFLYRRKTRAPSPIADGKTRVIVAEGFANFSTWDMVRVRIAGIASLLVAFLPTKRTGCESGDALLRGFAQLPPAPNFDTYLGRAPETLEVWFDFWRVFGVENTIADRAHSLAAGVMFLILGYMSLVVFTRLQSPDAAKGGSVVLEVREPSENLTRQKRIRNVIYVLCGLLIFVCVGLLGIKSYLVPDDSQLEVWLNSWNATFLLETIALWAFALSWLVKGRFVRRLNDPTTAHARRMRTVS